MKGISTFLAVCLFTLLCGCMLKYEDVSKEPEYTPLLNTCYSLRTDMLIYGVNLDPGYGKDIDIYEIVPMSMRTRGPEIIMEDTLNTGTILEVQSVKRSINSVLFEGKNIQAVVRVNPYAKSVNVPVVIDLKYIQSTNYVSKLEERTGDNFKEWRKKERGQRPFFKKK